MANDDKQYKKAAQTITLIEDLEYISTSTNLFLKISYKGYHDICIKTSRLRDLLMHSISFNVLFFEERDSKILAVLDKENDQEGEYLGNLLLYSDEVFSYAYEFFPDVRVVREYKALYEEQEKPKTVVKD